MSAEKQTNYRFDAVYIVSAGSAVPALPYTGFEPTQLATPALQSTQLAAPPVTIGYYGTALSPTLTVGGTVSLQEAVLSSNTTLVSVPTFFQPTMSADYQELGLTLAALNSSTDEEWKIDKPIYEIARYVASELMAESYPAPKLFIHGPNSVVFLWEEGANNLYLTVSEHYISALALAGDEIQARVEFDRSTLPGTSILLPAIESARLGRPVLSSVG